MSKDYAMIKGDKSFKDFCKRKAVESGVSIEKVTKSILEKIKEGKIRL